MSLQTFKKTSRFRFINCDKYNKGYCIIPHAAQISLRENNAFKMVFSDSKSVFKLTPCCIFSGMVSEPSSKMAEEGESERW